MSTWRKTHAPPKKQQRSHKKKEILPVTADSIMDAISDFYEENPDYTGDAGFDIDINWWVAPHGGDHMTASHDGFAQEMLMRVNAPAYMLSHSVDTLAKFGFIRVEQRANEFNVQIAGRPTDEQMRAIDGLYDQAYGWEEEDTGTHEVVYDFMDRDLNYVDSGSVASWKKFEAAVNKAFADKESAYQSADEMKVS